MRASPQQDNDVYKQYRTTKADEVLRPLVAQVSNRAFRGLGQIGVGRTATTMPMMMMMLAISF